MVHNITIDTFHKNQKNLFDTFILDCKLCVAGINKDDRPRLSPTEVCEDCGAELQMEIISQDADGNRLEWGLMCPICHN